MSDPATCPSTYSITSGSSKATPWGEKVETGVILGSPTVDIQSCWLTGIDDMLVVAVRPLHMLGGVREVVVLEIDSCVSLNDCRLSSVERMPVRDPISVTVSIGVEERETPSLGVGLVGLMGVPALVAAARISIGEYGFVGFPLSAYCAYRSSCLRRSQVCGAFDAHFA